MSPRDNIRLSQDAALVAALAGTAMSFSHSADDQAERWLRALRLHGQVGTAMQALGVGEAPLQVAPPAPRPALGSSPPRGDAVELVLERAHVQASRRRDSAVCTPDLLFALLEVYDTLVDRALQLRGSSREELVERLDATGSAVEA